MKPTLIDLDNPIATRAILIATTGRQGRAIISAMLANGPADFFLLAATSDPNSEQAKNLATEFPSVKLIYGDVKSPLLVQDALEAAAAAGISGLWGVFAAPFDGINSDQDEAKLGRGLVDAAVKAQVKYFVLTGIDRGGDEESWSNPTEVPQLKSSHEVEIYLRDWANVSEPRMGWTVFRATNVMETIFQGYESMAYLTAYRNVVGETSVQWVSVKDIAFFVAKAFRDPEVWNGKAMGLAGDDLTFSQLEAAHRRAKKKPVELTSNFTANFMLLANPWTNNLFKWLKAGGYGISLVNVRSKHSSVMTMEQWLKGSHSE